MRSAVLACCLFAVVLYAQSDRRQELLGMIGGMQMRLNGQPGPRQVVADSDRLAAGFSGLAPLAGGFGGSDAQLNRQIAEDAFSWLGRASAMYPGDPAVSRSLLRTYGVIGDFCRSYGSFYPPGAAMGFAGSNRMARSLVLDPRGGKRFERDLEQTAMSWAAVAYTQQAMFGGPPQQPSAPDAAPPLPEIPLTPLPQVDESKLDDQQKELWADARDRFNSVAPKVREARVLMAQLAVRLAQQGPNITVNPQDAAAALMMQGFLDDAADFIRAGQFDKASEALTRADYQKNKLRSVTGQ